MQAVQFAPVNSCARTSPLEAFQLQMLFMMRTTTDDLGMPVPVIFHELCCEFWAGCDCQVKYVKSHCHIINSGTVLVRKQFYFHAVSNTKIMLKIGRVLAKLQQVKPGAFLGHSVCPEKRDQNVFHNISHNSDEIC